MPTFAFVYVREQRVYLEQAAATEDEAYDLLVNSGGLDELKLDSADDESDDPGVLCFMYEVDSD